MTNPVAPGPLAGIKTTIRAHLRASGRSQTALAGQVGISRKHMSQVLTGRATGDALLIARLAEAVGLTLAAVRPDGQRTEVADKVAAAVRSTAEGIARAIETSVCPPARQCREHPCADCHRYMQAQLDAAMARRMGGIR
jgi:transcriptional regulator with XRE-family HTH domain